LATSLLEALLLFAVWRALTAGKDVASYVSTQEPRRIRPKQNAARASHPDRICYAWTSPLPTRALSHLRLALLGSASPFRP